MLLDGSSWTDPSSVVAGISDATRSAGRASRTGDPEVVYGAGKTPAQVVEILRTLHAAHPERAVLATRLSPDAMAAVVAELPDTAVDEVASNLEAGDDYHPADGERRAGAVDRPRVHVAALQVAPEHCVRPRVVPEAVRSALRGSVTTRTDPTTTPGQQPMPFRSSASNSPNVRRTSAAGATSGAVGQDA